MIQAQRRITLGMAGTSRFCRERAYFRRYISSAGTVPAQPAASMANL